MLQSDEFEHTASRAGLIGLTAAGGAILGFFLQLLAAYYFGAGRSTDAFFMAQSTSELLSKLLLGGSIAAVFLPMFVERIAHGKQAEAWHLALNLLHLASAVLLAALALLAAFTQPFVHFIAPGFDSATSALTIRLLYVLLPAFLCLFLVDLATAMLHSRRRFALPASLRLVSPAVSVLSILLLAKTLGIYSLAIGVVAGSLVQIAILLAGLHRQGLRYRFVFWPGDPAIKKLLRLVYPFAFSVIVTQAAGIVYRILVSDLPVGSLSALKFGEKISQLLTVIFLGSVTAVLFPLLSEKASRRDYAGMRETIGSSIRLITFATLPVIIGVVLLRKELITFIYQRGSFTAEATSMTAIALLFLIIGLTANGVSSILGHAVLALQKTRAAVAVSIASQAVAIALFFLLVPSMGHAGLALTSSLVPLAIAALYFLYLKQIIPNLDQVFWHPTYLKVLMLSALLGFTVFFLHILSSKFHILLQLLLPTLAGAAVYFTGAYLLKIPEMRQLLTILERKFQSSAK